MFEPWTVCFSSASHSSRHLTEVKLISGVDCYGAPVLCSKKLFCHPFINQRETFPPSFSFLTLHSKKNVSPVRQFWVYGSSPGVHAAGAGYKASPSVLRMRNFLLQNFNRLEGKNQDDCSWFFLHFNARNSVS